MSKQSDNIETKGANIMDSINLSTTNKTNIPSQGVTQNSQQKTAIKTNEIKEDTFEREDKSKMSTRKQITKGALIIAGIWAVTEFIIWRCNRSTNKILKEAEKTLQESKKYLEELGNI